jgi:alpha-L-fucosidase 2
VKPEAESLKSQDDASSSQLTRRSLIRTGLALGAGIPASSVLARSATTLSGSDTEANESAAYLKESASILWYEKPAKEWVEALPIGNGRLGAMVFGGALKEQIQLNESTMWAGGPHDYDNPEGLAALPEIRRLVFAGKYREAAELADHKFMSKPLGQLQYQTIGDLQIEFSNLDTPTAYKRDLNLDLATASTEFTSNGISYRRQVIASHPDNVIAIRIEANHHAAISFSASFSTPQKASVRSDDDHLILSGIGSDSEGIPGQVRFAAIAQVITEGGSHRIEDGKLVVRNADAVTLLVSIATSYVSYKDVSADPISLALNHLRGPAQKPFSEILEAHIADHRKIFTRVTLDLGPTKTNIPTNIRINEFQSGEDPGLAALYYQYGRYLMIACSRPGGKPANLQGIWNNSLTPPWGSKYTVNINTEMNYWPVETCGLSECHIPLFDMLEEVAQTGAKTAQVEYGAKGWVLHHNTDGWRGAAPIDGASWGLWPTGGAWLSTHMWQHFLFTGNKKSLARYYPTMKGAAEFFLDTLVEYPGKDWLVTCPSTSPENSHHNGTGLCAGPTMDMQILRDLFQDCIDASEVLGVDEALRTKLKATRSRLAPMQIGSSGQLQEWLEDWDAQAPEIHHRHVSHMYGVFPSQQITRDGTPALFEAAKKSLEMRGDAGTGWSLAWKINIWARLLDGDHAYKLVLEALRPQGTLGEAGGVYPNLFDAHPPFQIDGNFGFTSGVAEMLVQSTLEDLHLLPALPSAWPQGHVKGLRARGGHEVTMTWAEGKVAHAEVVLGWKESVRVHYAGKVVDVKGRRGSKHLVG